MLGASLADVAGGLVPPDIAAGAAGRGDRDVRFDDLTQLAAIVKNRLNSIQYRPALIEGFLSQTDFTLQPQPP